MESIKRIESEIIIRFGKFFSTIISIINFISVVASLLLLLNVFNYYIISKVFLSITVIICLSLSLIINKLHEKYCLMGSYSQAIKQTRNSLEHYHDNSTEESRKTIRNYLIPIFASVEIILIIIFTCFKSLKFIPWTTCLIIIAYIYADYLPPAIRNAKKYHKLYVPNISKTSCVSGMSKLYEEEYKLTDFDYKNDFYREYYKYWEQPESKDKDECIKCILYSFIDNFQNKNIIVNAIILIISSVLIHSKASVYICSIYLGNVSIDKLKMATYVMLVMFTIISYGISEKSTALFEKNTLTIKRIIHSFESDSRERIGLYKELTENDCITEIIRARGIYSYGTGYIDSGKTLNNVNLEYRMLFIHKYQVNIERFNITSLLIVLALFFFLLQLELTSIHIIVSLILVATILILFRIKILPNMWKKQIIYKYNR